MRRGRCAPLPGKRGRCGRSRWPRPLRGARGFHPVPSCHRRSRACRRACSSSRERRRRRPAWDGGLCTWTLRVWRPHRRSAEKPLKSHARRHQRESRGGRRCANRWETRARFGCRRRRAPSCRACAPALRLCASIRRFGARWDSPPAPDCPIELLLYEPLSPPTPSTSPIAANNSEFPVLRSTAEPRPAADPAQSRADLRTR